MRKEYLFECSRYDALKGIKDFRTDDELLASGTEFRTLAGTYNLKSDKVTMKGDKFETFNYMFHILLLLYYDFDRLYNLLYDDESKIHWTVLDVLDEIVVSMKDEFKSIFCGYDFIFEDKDNEDDSNACCKECKSKDTCSICVLDAWDEDYTEEED